MGALNVYFETLTFVGGVSKRCTVWKAVGMRAFWKGHGRQMKIEAAG